MTHFLASIKNTEAQLYSFTKRPSAASLGCYRLDGAFPRVCPGTGVEPDCTPVPAPCPALLTEDQCSFGLRGCPLLLIDIGQSVVLKNMGLDLNSNLALGFMTTALPSLCLCVFLYLSSILEILKSGSPASRPCESAPRCGCCHSLALCSMAVCRRPWRITPLNTKGTNPQRITLFGNSSFGSV